MNKNNDVREKRPYFIPEVPRLQAAPKTAVESKGSIIYKEFMLS